MLTEKAQEIIDLSKDYSYSGGCIELTFPSLLAAVAADTESSVLLCDAAKLNIDRIRELCPKFPDPTACPGKLPLAKQVQSILNTAKELTDEVPDRTHPSLVDFRHIIGAMIISKDVCRILKIKAKTKEEVVLLLSQWYQKEKDTPRLENLTGVLNDLRAELLQKVYGQDHAVETFIEGLFNAQATATADKKRKAPSAVFIFAGPQGVGKTFLAEAGAASLKLPFKRFDMTAYSGHQQNEMLVGMDKVYNGARPGILTEFVEKNPDAILLFDEIEKAHLNTIHLFLQILDAGHLEDKYYDRNVNFRDTIIIFTTNAGRKLYDRPERSGMAAINANFHRQTILEALKIEKNPTTRAPVFPEAICSRLATGYPVLFNHLQINDLEKVVNSELKRVCDLIELQHYKKVSYDKELPICLVLREGGRADARILRSQAENFIKAELFNFCQLFKVERLEEVLKKVKRIRFCLDGSMDDLDMEIQNLFEKQDKPKILLICDTDLFHLYKDMIRDIQWFHAQTAEEALQILAQEDVDLVLHDLFVGQEGQSDLASKTIMSFDHIPTSAKSLQQGQEILRKISERLSDVPIFLLSLTEHDLEHDSKRTISNEVFSACMRAGGAREVIVSSFIDGLAKDWESHRDELLNKLMALTQTLHREKMANKMAKARKVLAFDASPKINHKEKEVVVRLRNLRLTMAIAAADTGEVLENIERPATSFDQVIGAKTAKEELQFFINYLKDPKRFAALGLKPPRGVLLYGPPGTGKTMLARAMAGESDVAFIPVSATNFVTIWQGSGPQNIRDLFARARRYAPAIIFIDEIDAIGRARLGAGHHAEESTLNALLTELDGFSQGDQNAPIFVLAATNFKIKGTSNEASEHSARMLDSALVRRFARTILVDLPDTETRYAYLSKRLKDSQRYEISDSVLHLIAEKSVTMTLADLEGVIEAASREALRKQIPLNEELLNEALDTKREGEAKKWSPEFLESTARHEAGHTIMYWLSGWWPPEVSIIARADHGGGMLRCEEEMKRESLTKDEILASIRMCLGGRAAEVIYYEEKGLTTGASSDLQHATHLVRNMICRYGMDKEFGLATTPELLRPEAAGSPLYERMNEIVVKVLADELENTLVLLKENKKHLDNVVSALAQKNRLYKKDLEKILTPAHGKTKNTKKEYQMKNAK